VLESLGQAGGAVPHGREGRQVERHHLGSGA
jgi:hypothetical protein